LKGQLPGLYGRERERGHCTCGLDSGCLDRLSRFGGDRAGDLLVAATQARRDADEDLRALVRGQGILQSLLGGVERAPNLGGAALRDPADDVTGIGRPDLAPLAGLHPLALDQEAPLGRRDGHATQSRARGVS